MVKNAIRRIILRYFPEIGERKHLPQLARIEKVHDLPVGDSKISTGFRAYKAADIQLLNALTGEPLSTPIFEQVTLATGQAHERGVFIEPSPGMHCLIQYIDGLNSMPVITSILPWQSLVPENKSTDVVLQQSSNSKIKGSDEDWHIQTPGEIKQTSQKNIVDSQVSEQSFHKRDTTITGHDTSKIDGNQVNEIMGALKTLVGEKAIIVALDNLLLGSEKEVNIESTENTNLKSGKQINIESADNMSIKSIKDLFIEAKNITAAADLIKLNGGTGVITCESICHFTGGPHADGSLTVLAGKT